MAVNELTLPTWNSLDEKRQRFIFQQLTRYFLSPLLTVDEIRPVTATFYGQTLHTFEAMIGGMGAVDSGDGPSELGVSCAAARTTGFLLATKRFDRNGLNAGLVAATGSRYAAYAGCD